MNLLFVMKSALNDFQLLVGTLASHAVDEPMLSEVRLDQNPDRSPFNGSGLPRTLKGDLFVSFRSSLIFSTIFWSLFCQYSYSSQEFGVHSNFMSEGGIALYHLPLAKLSDTFA